MRFSPIMIVCNCFVALSTIFRSSLSPTDYRGSFIRNGSLVMRHISIESPLVSGDQHDCPFAGAAPIACDGDATLRLSASDFTACIRQGTTPESGW